MGAVASVPVGSAAAPLAQVEEDVSPLLAPEDVPPLGTAPPSAEAELDTLRQLRQARLAAVPSLSRVLPRQLRRRRMAVREAVGKSALDVRGQMAMLREALTPEQWQILRAMGKARVFE